MRMIIKIIACVSGTAALAAVMLGGIALSAATLTAMFGSVIGAALALIPTIFCVGGVAYAASRAKGEC